MRAILFRAKRQEPGDEGNGVWCYGDIVHMPKNLIMMVNPRYWDYLDIMESPFDPLRQAFMGYVVPETVGQFTGFYDKNGKKIFEGDVVRAETYHDYGQCGETREETYTVEWDKRKALFYPFNIVDGDYLRLETFEVIGNIHDKTEGGDQDGRT